MLPVLRSKPWIQQLVGGQKKFTGARARHVVPWSPRCQPGRQMNDRAMLAFVHGKSLSTISNNNTSSCCGNNSIISSSRYQAPQFSSVAAEISESDSEDDVEYDESVDLQQQQQNNNNNSIKNNCREAYSTKTNLPEVNKASLQDNRHCETCTCEEQEQQRQPTESAAPRLVQQPPCQGNLSAWQTDDDTEQQQQQQPLPPPLPEPQYSVRRRLLSSGWTVALQSAPGQERLLQSLQNQTAASYIALTQHFLNQAEPAYCAITTACMVLNALEMDSVWRWKGGWRYYASEEVVLAHCQGCWSTERLQRVGMTAEEFQKLVTCQGLDSTFKRPYTAAAAAAAETIPTTATTTNNINNHTDKQQQQSYSLDEFRSDVQTILTSNTTTTANNTRPRGMGILVVSFCRGTLGQTGDGHFSPIAAYHPASDSVLVLDVARYKYPPYWVSLTRLYQAMQPCDSATKKPRGWFLLYDHGNHHKQSSRSSRHNDVNSCRGELEDPARAAAGAEGVVVVLQENRRPAHLVPVVGRDPHPCPMHPVQVQFCPNQEKRPALK